MKTDRSHILETKRQELDKIVELVGKHFEPNMIVWQLCQRRLCVPGVGIEPARTQCPQDFKSCDLGSFKKLRKSQKIFFTR